MVCIQLQSEPSCTVSAAYINEGEHVDANTDGRIVMRESNEDLVIVSLHAVSDPQLHREETADALLADETLCNVLEKVGPFPLAHCILLISAQVSSLFKENLVCKHCALIFHRPFMCVLC